MVERLKNAIEKARRDRSGVGPDAQATVPAGDSKTLPIRHGATWQHIPEARLTARDLDRARIMVPTRNSGGVFPLEHLGSRLLGLCKASNWKRVAIVPTTMGCGASTVALNLAFALSRNDQARVLVVDLDLGAPTFAKRLGLKRRPALTALLAGERAPEDLLLRIGDSLLVLPNAERLPPGTPGDTFRNLEKMLDDLAQTFEPDLMLLDLPPVSADAEALRTATLADATLQVAAANVSTAPEIDACARLLDGSAAYLGVTLNRVNTKRSGAMPRELA